LPAALRPQLAEFQATTRRAAELTEQLLLFARRRAMKPEPLEFNSGIASVLKLLRRLLGEHVAVNLSLAAEPLWISADAGMIDQCRDEPLRECARRDAGRWHAHAGDGGGGPWNRASASRRASRPSPACA